VASISAFLFSRNSTHSASDSNPSSSVMNRTSISGRNLLLACELKQVYDLNMTQQAATRSRSTKKSMRYPPIFGAEL
jgi:hypothetical protein